MEKNHKKTIVKLILLIAGILLIVVMIHRAGWNNIIGTISGIDPFFLFLLCAIQVLTLAACAYQLHYMMNCSGIAIPYRKVLSIYLTGSFVESITPSVKLGGEAVKVYLLKKHSGGDYDKLTGVFAAYKIISFLPFLVVMILSAVFIQVEMGMNVFVYTGFFVLLVTAVVLLYYLIKKSKIKRLIKIKEFVGRTLYHAKNALNRKQILFMLFVSLGIWLAYPVKMYFVAYLLGRELPFATLSAVVYTGYIISMVPLAPGGLGSFEGSIVFMLGRIGVSSGYALSIVLITRFVTYWFPLVLSGFFAFFTLFNKKAIPAE